MKQAMRKFLILGMFLVAAFVIMGCNGQSTDLITAGPTTQAPTTQAPTTQAPTVPVVEQIEAPSGLSITGNNLSWNAVTGATGYVIYVNGTQQTTVTTTTYDFTSLSGDQFIFQVKALAPTGQADSVLSASVAFVANAAQEVTAIIAQLETMDMLGMEDFAAELVRKGMTAADFDATVTLIQTFMADMDEVEDMLDGNTLVKGLLASDVNFEAIVSAIVVGVLPGYLQMMIDDAYDQEEADMYQAMLDMVEDNHDEIVLAVVATIEYFIAFQEDVTNSFLTSIMGLMETEDLSSLNTAEVILLKDEIVSILTDNLPTTDHIVLVYHVMMAAAEALSGSEISYPVASFDAKYAVQLRLSLQAIIALIDIIDANYINSLKTIQATSQAQLQAVDITVLNLQYVRNYIDENAVLFSQIDQVFTESEKLALFNDMIAMVSAQVGDIENPDTGMSMALMMLLMIIQNLDYEVVESFGELVLQSLEKIMDHLIATEGELLRVIMILQAFSYDWDYYFDGTDYVNVESWYNHILDEEYDNWTEFDYARQLANVDVIREVLLLMNAIIEDLDSDDAEVVASLLISLQIPNILFPYMMDMLEDEADEIIADIEALVTALLPRFLTLIQNGIGVVVDQEMADGLATMFDEIHAYYVNLYGADYQSSTGYDDDDHDYDTFQQAIFLSEYIYQILTTTEQANILAMVASVFDAEDLLDFVSLMIFASEQSLAPFESVIGDVLTFIVTEVSVFRTYSVDSLTQAQKERILEFPDAIEAILESAIPTE